MDILRKDNKNLIKNPYFCCLKQAMNHYGTIIINI